MPALYTADFRGMNAVMKLNIIIFMIAKRREPAETQAFGAFTATAVSASCTFAAMLLKILREMLYWLTAAGITSC